MNCRQTFLFCPPVPESLTRRLNINCKCSVNSSDLLLASFYIYVNPYFLIYALPHGGTFISMACSSPAPSVSD